MKTTPLLLLLLLLFTACDHQQANDTAATKKKGRSISAPYELLVVCDKEWLSTSAAEPFNELLRTEVPALPQSEPLMRTTTINPNAMSGTFLYYANVLQVDVSSKYATAECKMARDVYCQPQLVVTLTAPTQQAFDSLLALHGEAILQAYVEGELQQEAARLNKQYSRQLQQAAHQQFGIDIHAPKEIDAVRSETNFLWASSDNTEENYYNMVIYSYPLPVGDFATHRHEALATTITAPTEGSFMSLDSTLLIEREIVIDGQRVSEVRGLWQMEHAAMGGPFISHTYADSLRARALVVEAFVFAPGKDKRTFMRRLEAALRTVKIDHD